MGWEQFEIRLIGKLERHNSAGDALDDAALVHLRETLDRLVAKPEYARLAINVV